MPEIVVLTVLCAIGLLLLSLAGLWRLLGPYLSYLYVNARIRAKEARLLRDDTIEAMVHADSVQEIAALLEHSEYADLMQGLVVADAESIEQLLQQQAADMQAEVSRLLPLRARTAATLLRQQWDVRNIKMICRGFAASLPAEQVRAGLVAAGDLERTLLDAMIDAATMADALLLLGDTAWAQLAEAAADPGATRLAMIERRLDCLLLGRAWDAVSVDREMADLQEICAARIDAYNCLALLRAKHDRLLLSDIGDALVPGGLLPERAIRTFDEIDDVADLVSMLEGTWIHPCLEQQLAEYENSGMLGCFEHALETWQLQQGCGVALRRPYGIAPVLGYLSRREAEMRTVRAVARAKEAGLSAEIIATFIVRV